MYDQIQYPRLFEPVLVEDAAVGIGWLAQMPVMDFGSEQYQYPMLFEGFPETADDVLADSWFLQPDNQPTYPEPSIDAGTQSVFFTDEDLATSDDVLADSWFLQPDNQPTYAESRPFAGNPSVFFAVDTTVPDVLADAWFLQLDNQPTYAEPAIDAGTQWSFYELEDSVIPSVDDVLSEEWFLQPDNQPTYPEDRIFEGTQWVFFPVNTTIPDVLASSWFLQPDNQPTYPEDAIPSDSQWYAFLAEPDDIPDPVTDVTIIAMYTFQRWYGDAIMWENDSGEVKASRGSFNEPKDFGADL